MKRKTLSIILISAALLLTVSLTASLIAFASPPSASVINNTEDNPAPTGPINSALTEMKVCTEWVAYYKDIEMGGNPIGRKNFGEAVLAEEDEEVESVMRIYNESGALLGYCDKNALVPKNAAFYAEVPLMWNEEGQISRLVDLRKYAMIFDAPIICDDDRVILIQYDTMLKLFDVAEKFYSDLSYTLVIENAYLSASAVESGVCCGLSHSNGAHLTLKMLKIGESETEEIPLLDISDPSGEKLSVFASLLSDYSFISESGSCFYDSDYESYMHTELDMSSITYSIWE